MPDANRPALAGMPHFVERHPWEAGFADEFQHRIVPDLGAAMTRRRRAERLSRRRLPLLLASGAALTLLVAEASGSLPITLFWAVLILILGGWLSRAPVANADERALLAVRDQVAGFFELRHLPPSPFLESTLRGSGLLPPGGRLGCRGQLWGIRAGQALRIASVTLGQSSLSRAEADRDGTPATGAGPPGLLIVIEPAPSALEGGYRGEEARADARLSAVSDALGGAPVRCAQSEGRLLLLADTAIGCWDWSRTGERACGPTGLNDLEPAIRAMLRSVHMALNAAALLGRPDPVADAAGETVGGIRTPVAVHPRPVGPLE